MMSGICCFFNYPPLYRFPIYSEMARHFGCDFFFGNTVFESIRSFDPHTLPGYRGTLSARPTGWKGYIWHGGARRLFLRRYSHYILTGEPALLLTWLIMLWAKCTGRKVLLWTHGIHEYYPKWTSRLVYSLYFRLADVLLMYGDYNRHYMTDLGCRPERIRVFHNSLDTSLQRELFLRQTASDVYQRHFGNDCPTVIYIGRLQRRKRIGQLLQAMALLRDEGKDYNLVLVGDGTDADDLCRETERLGLQQRVWFYGPSYDEQTNAELLYNAHVCVCPAAVGLTAIHAMSYGCPVVSNDDIESQMPEHESILPGITGSFFHVDDVSDLASHIHTWCRRTSLERNQTRELAHRHMMQEWSVDYQIALLKQILLQPQTVISDRTDFVQLPPSR